MSAARIAGISALAICLALALALALSPSTAPASTSTTFTVTKTADSADGSCDNDCSLREAIIAANETPGQDTVVVPAGTYLLDIDVAALGGLGDANTGDLDILDSVTLVGDGAASTIIDAQGIDRVIEVAASGVQIAVSIDGVTVRGGETDSAGGGIKIDVEFGAVTISNSVITENTASSGGGISADTDEVEATVTITNTQITHNTATSYAGGVNDSLDDGLFRITDSVVSDNTAQSYAAGILHETALMEIRESVITGNQSMGYSGGIQNNQDGTLSIFDSTISENTAAKYAGGIMNNQDGTLSIFDSTISENTAANYAGGIMNNRGGTINITGSTVAGNTAQQYGGGVMQNGSGVINIANSTISGNTAMQNGGGGIYQNGDGPINLTSTTIALNHAAGGSGVGGGIHTNDPGPITPLDTIIGDNTPNDCFFDDADLNNPTYTLDSDDSCDLIGATNLQNRDPELGPLADNGGPTLTHALLEDSPAIDAGSPDCPDDDQRGVSRPQGDACDIGSVESVPLPPRIQGDVNCDGLVNEIDLLVLLEGIATGGLGGPCPAGPASVPADARDVNCDGAINTLDVLHILLHLAQLPEPPKPGDCADVGDPLS